MSQYRKGENQSGFYWSKRQWVAVAISWAICKSASHSRQITTPTPHQQFFTGRMPFLSPNQQRQSTERGTERQQEVQFLPPERHLTSTKHCVCVCMCQQVYCANDLTGAISERTPVFLCQSTRSTNKSAAFTNFSRSQFPVQTQTAVDTQCLYIPSVQWCCYLLQGGQLACKNLLRIPPKSFCWGQIKQRWSVKQ